MRRLFQQLLPFVFLGIALVALAFGIFILAYLFFIGTMLGLVLFTLSWIRTKFFPPKNLPVRYRRGRTYDSDDWKNL